VIDEFDESPCPGCGKHWMFMFIRTLDGYCTDCETKELSSMRAKTPEELEFEHCNEILRDLSGGEQLGWPLANTLTKIIMRFERQVTDLQAEVNSLAGQLADLNSAVSRLDEDYDY